MQKQNFKSMWPLKQTFYQLFQQREPYFSSSGSRPSSLFFQIFSICLTSLKELSKHFKDVQKFALKLLKWQSMNGGAYHKICHIWYLGEEPSFSAGLWETLCCSFSSVWPRLKYRGLQTSKTNKTQVWGWHLASLYPIQILLRRILDMRWKSTSAGKLFTFFWSLQTAELDGK